MEVIESNSQYEPKFAYAHIFWNIKYYFFFTRNDTFTIRSAKFSVDSFCLTNWRLILKGCKVNEKDPVYSTVEIYLENLDSRQPVENIKIFWNMWYFDDILRKRMTLCDVENAYPVNTIGGRVNDISFINILKFCPLTRLKIEGYLLIKSTEDTFTFNRPKHQGMKNLSQDLNTHFCLQEKEETDLIVRIGKYILPCNRAILSVRNQILKTIIADNNKNKRFVLEFKAHQHLDAIKSVFQYLYSASLEHVLRFPSVSIGKAIEVFKVRELEMYYPKNKITLETTYGAKEFYFEWNITDINTRKDIFFLSPDFSDDTLNTTFRLHLDMKRTSRSPFLGIRIEIVQGITPRILDVQFEIITTGGKSINRRVMRWSDVKDKIENFLPKSTLKLPDVVGLGTLTILFSIYIPEQGTETKSVHISESLHSNISYGEHYELLSTQLGTLLRTKEYSDFTIICRGEKIAVHKCILGARSSFLRQLVRKRKEMSMNIFDPNILRIVIFYMYTGRLRISRKSDIIKVYLTARKLSVRALQNFCHKILPNSFSIRNVLETLFFAVDNKLPHLKKATFPLIINNLTILRAHSDWVKLITDYFEVFEEIVAFEAERERQNSAERC